MSKICGLTSKDRCSDLQNLLGCMYEASWLSCYQRRETWSNDFAGLGHFGIGAVNLEKQPITDFFSGSTAVFCGKIFDYHAEHRCLAGEGVKFHHSANDGEFLIHWLMRRGFQALREINGIFSLAVWDPKRRTLILTGDRYGFRPLYYYHDTSRGILAFASDLRSVLSSGLPTLRVNWPAVNVFLRLGHVIGDETLFSGIFRLPPASVLTFRDNTLKVDRYWSPTELQIQENMSIEDAVDGCVDFFRQAIRRRVNTSPARHIVLLSGGQDSRHIAAELKHQKVEFTTYTTTGFSPTVQDKILAKRLAEKLAVPHVYVPLPKKNFLTEYWPRAHSKLDYEADLHEWILPLIDDLPNEPHINFDGIVGDTCLSSVYLNQPNYLLVREGRYDELARQLVEREHWPPVFHPSIARHLDREILFELIRAQFQAFAGHPNMINFTHMTMRTARAISLFAFKLVLDKAESYYPFADNHFFNFAMSIPLEHKLDRKLHRRVIDRAYPDLSSIPTTKEINRDDYRFDEINYLEQKRHYLCRGVVKILGGKLWIFDRRAALPRVLRDITKTTLGRDDRFFLCNPAFAVLAEWFDRYFPDGVD